MSESQRLLNFSEDGFHAIIADLLPDRVRGDKIEISFRTMSQCTSQIIDLVEGLLDTFDPFKDFDFVHDIRFALRDVYALSVLLDVCVDLEAKGD